MNVRTKKKWLYFFALPVLLVLLSACGQGTINQNSTGLWDRYIVYYFAQAIKGLSFGNSGIGIILFTLIIRIILLPLMHFQTKSMRRMQEVQPQLKALQEKYSSKDPETMRLLQEEQQKLYKEHGVNPFSGCLPMLVQLPIMTALYQAISRDPDLTKGTFLWLHLGARDPYLILPILAAIFTYASTKLNNMSAVEENGMTKMMAYTLPVIIFVTGMSVASGLSLYWAVSNAFQVGQTLLINNPFKIRREREEAERKRREREKALEKAKKAAKKKKRK